VRNLVRSLLEASMTAKLVSITALTCALSLTGAATALANGGDFFEELAATWTSANSDEGVPYFGFAKDTRGKFLPGVAISATTASGSSFVVQTDNMGRYRIPGFSKSVDAKRVQVTCSKTGYKLVARDRRVMRSTTDVPIETNCVLAPEAGKPVS
jgi:hypothetical protein